jgi:carbamoyl-phosphate synthase small subunit
MKAELILENGMVFEGSAIGKTMDTVGEVVFNTGMTGYQEILTDPSYYGQIVVMTYPLIGNYGLNLEDVESKGPKIKGFIVREMCKLSSNFRSEFELQDYLFNNDIIGLEGIDTRHLTKILRSFGTMKGLITTRKMSRQDLKSAFHGFGNKDAVAHVTTPEKYWIEGEGKHIAILDYGAKDSIIRNFIKRNCRLTVFPYDADHKEILDVDPDMIFLSNGPGDPADLTHCIETIKHLAGQKPVAGICLGHQLIALALGGETSKLKFGHRGCNHPVKDLISGKVYITSQNHGYHVSKLPDNAVLTHISLNDGTVEGMQMPSLNIRSVQFHPEASPGPQESDYLFDQFLSMIKEA